MRKVSNSRIQLTIGIISIVIIAIVGIATKLVSIGEGIIIILITLVSSPFLFNLLKKTPEHDDR
jgi:hypothetical protein